MFNRMERGKLVDQTSKRTKRSKWLVYRDLRRYWQGGQSASAVIAPLYKRGGRGKPRDTSKAKVGRMSKRLISALAEMDCGVEVTAGELALAEGCKLDSRIIDLMDRGINRFYDKCAPRPSVRKAYDDMNAVFFRSHYDMRLDGVSIPVLLPEHQRPSLGQFEYRINKTRYTRKSRKNRFGETAYNLTRRPLTGDRTMLARGPGALWYIDATVADVYLVSSFNRQRIIGRPVIYVVIDAFSQLIVGFAVTLEGPNWIGAMLAIENATTEKISFCARYKITIDEADWPVACLPEELYADRGELISPNADDLARLLDIRIGNAAPYRADWKAEVEREFKLLNDTAIHWLPGAVYKARERGDKDYRLDACLTLDEFRQIIIRCVLNHNRYHKMSTYPMGADLVADGVEPFPLDLWHWGIRNRAGLLHTAPRESIRRVLLRKGTAMVTERGIRFEGVNYMCPLAVEEHWAERAREKGHWAIEVSFDPRLPGTLYHYPQADPTKSGQILTQMSGHRRMYGQRDLYEIMDLRALRAKRRLAGKPRDDQQRVALAAEIAHITAQAQAATAASARDLSKSERTASIRANRQEERDRERATDAWRMPDNDAARDTQQEPATALTRPDGDEAGIKSRDDQRIKLLCLRRERLQPAG